MKKHAARMGWKYLLLLAGVLLTILVILFVRTREHDSSGDFDKLMLMREIRELDSGWELEVLRAKTGLDDNYDSLADPLTALEDRLGRLQSILAKDARVDGPAMGPAAAAIQSAFREKIRLIEAFKSHNAILRNSVFFLPSAIEDFGTALLADDRLQSATRQQALTLADTALLDCLAYGLVQTHEAELRVRRDLQRLTGFEARLSAATRPRLDIMRAHVEKVLQEEPVVNAILRAVIKVPTTASVNTAQQMLITKGQIIGQQSQQDREYLLIFSAALALLFLFAGARLIHSHAIISRMVTALRSESQAKSRFMANISHELRTPLTSIISYAELMQEIAAEEQRETDVADGDVIIRSARHLLTLISEVLDFAKLDAGGIKIELAEFACDDLLALVREMLEPLAAANGNRFELIADGDLGTLRSDQFRLRQCLLNLGSNAAKFTKDGVISVIARREPRGSREGLCFDVRDTGMGMCAEVVGRLFEPFRQGEDSIARQFGGTGLGLAITRELVRLLGGDIRVESEPGAGTTFSLWIPADCAAVPSVAAKNPGQNLSQLVSAT